MTEREYDSRGNVRVIREFEDDPLSSPIETIFTYDSGNRVESITNALNETTTFDYDSQGNLDRITNALEDFSEFTYDDRGRRETFTDFNGNTTTFEYENGDQPTKVIFDDDTYQVFAYNQFGQVTLEEYYEADGSIAERRETEYDSSGRVVAEISGRVKDGESVSFDQSKHPHTEVRKFYDGGLLDWEIIVHPDSLDAEGNLLESPETPVDERQSRITDYEYNAIDQLVRQIDAEGGVVDFRYDANGNRVALRDPVGNITTWLYDELNRAVEERDPFYWEDLRESDAVFESLTDDEFLELIAPAAPVSATDETVDPLYDDPSGADCETNTGAEHVRLTCYDSEGNQSKTIDRNGRRREFEYDHAGRLEEERWYNESTHVLEPNVLVETITFTYDSLGNMQTASDSNSNYLFQYDALNRLESVDNNPDGTRDVPRVILTYAYDAQGNVTLTQDDAGVTVTSHYNARNQLEWRKWFDADGGGDVDDARVDFQYTAAGRELGIQRYSDLIAETLVGSTTRTYDLAGRSDVLRHDDAANALIASYGYDYDFGGLLTGETRGHQDSQFAQDIVYRYDLTGQLTDAEFTSPTGTAQDDEHFEYDANGNRLLARMGTDQQTYTPDTANQLESDGQYRYEYDGEGNQVKRVPLLAGGSDDPEGVVRTFVYDHRNRLVRVDDWSSDPSDPQRPVAGAVLTQSVEYTYDTLGRRIAREVDPDGAAGQLSEKEFFVYNGDNVWADINDREEVVARYLFANNIDGVIADFTRGEGTVWYFPDRLQTIRDLLVMPSNVLSHTEFSSFGSVLSQRDGAPEGRYAFTGREFDSNLQLSYYRARFLESESGRFLSRDPIGFAGLDSNLYRYVGNNVPGLTDPSGRAALVEVVVPAAVGAAVAGFAGARPGEYFNYQRAGFGFLLGAGLALGGGVLAAGLSSGTPVLGTGASVTVAGGIAGGITDATGQLVECVINSGPCTINEVSILAAIGAGLVAPWLGIGSTLADTGFSAILSLAHALAALRDHGQANVEELDPYFQFVAEQIRRNIG